MIGIPLIIMIIIGVVIYKKKNNKNQVTNGKPINHKGEAQKNANVSNNIGNILVTSNIRLLNQNTKLIRYGELLFANYFYL